MPAKTKTSSTKQWEVLFVQCELDAATKKQVKAWDGEYKTTLDAVERLILDGYKISSSFDRFHDCVGVFCTMPQADHKHHGLCLSARAPNFLDALKVLVFKHFTLLQENWDTNVNAAPKQDQWG